MSGQARRRIVLITSNGWGLGHLSRAIAIALAIGDRGEVTMFSFSRGLPLVAQFGIRGEFCPGPDSPWISPERWRKYVERRLQLFLDETRPDVVLFDGVAPYNGVINALRKRPAISAGWLRRGMWLAGPTDHQLTKANAFDFIIEPGDIAADADTGPTAGLASIGVPPVSLLEVVPSLNRQEAAAALGLDSTKPTLLLGLGSGQPGDPLDARNAAIGQALQHTDWQVGAVSSPLANRSEDSTAKARESEDARNVVRIQGVYPLTRYLAAFDAAISAAGYNSVHELIPAGIPTLFIPKSASRTDNQMARAAFLAHRRLALTAHDDDAAAVRQQVDNLLGDARTDLVERLAEVPKDGFVGGAAAVADIVSSSTPVGIRKTGAEEWRPPGLRGLIHRIIPATGIELVKRILGRPTSGHPRDTPNLDSEEGVVRPLFSDELESVTRATFQPVEHVLEGASASYREARRGLFAEFYDPK